MNKNLKQLSLEQQEQQLAGRSNYKFFDNGYIDVYGFSFWLFESLWIDGFNVSTPNNLMDMFLDFVVNNVDEPQKIREIPINDMTPEMFTVYPESKTIMVHLSVPIHFIHDFIYALGEHYLGLKRGEKDRYFAYWIKREHIYTFTFLSGLFSEYRELMKKSPSIKSALAHMHISHHSGFDSDFVRNNLETKEGMHSVAAERIDNAIAEQFYLEAIALEESIISDRLSLSLYVQGQKANSKSFNDLIRETKGILPSELRNKIDIWRKSRNKALHNLVRSAPNDIQIGVLDFDQLANKTAQEGRELINELSIWFDGFIYDEMNPFSIKIID